MSTYSDYSSNMCEVKGKSFVSEYEEKVQAGMKVIKIVGSGQNFGNRGKEIIHYSNFFGGNAAEYIVPNGNITITSHGLGSGIYGLSQDYIDKNPPNITLSNRYTFIVENPYIISTEEQADNYIESSMNIMRCLESTIKREKVLDIYTIDHIVKNFVCNMPAFSIETVTSALLEFCNDYYFRKDAVEMPINYILKKVGYDGVVSEEGTSTHSWSKGNVKFIDYPTYKMGDKCHVAFIISRAGISRPMINLKSKGYALQSDNKWERLELLK